ncbi:MAG: dentilisin complex subunit PrcA [Treponema sp.]
MRKLFLLCVLSVFFFINCKDQNTTNQQNTPKPVPEKPKSTLGLEDIICDGVSVLPKMNKQNFCNFGKVKKYSLDLVVRLKDAGIVDVSVKVDEAIAHGSVPNYTCYLIDGHNIIEVTITSKTDPSKKETYKIKVNKVGNAVGEAESSRLKDIKVDGESIISQFGSNFVCNLKDAKKTKTDLELYVLPHNASATVTVTNGSENVEKIPDKKYKVSLSLGLNNIHISVNSQKEGTLVYKITIYREEELDLKSFKVEDTEYYDESTNKLKERVLEFPTDKEKVKVSVKAKDSNAKITFKHNGKVIEANADLYDLNLQNGNNGVEVIVSGLRSNTYSIVLVRKSPTKSGLIKFAADEEDLIRLFSSSNSVTLPPRDNEKTKLKLEVLTTSDVTVKVKLKNVEVTGTSGVYEINLEEGDNDIVVELYKGGTLSTTYYIFVKRHKKVETPTAPASDEVEVTFILSDGVNGSPVDGSYLNISKINPSETPKRILVKNGKAKANLKRSSYYDFKVEGRNDKYAAKKYAASNVISYYIGTEPKVVPIVQRALERVTVKAEAPVVDKLTFDSSEVTAGTLTMSDKLKQISMEVTTAAPIEELRFTTPLPMLGVGFVPSTYDVNRSDVIPGTMTKESEKLGDKWKAICAWNSDISLVKEEDVVIVLYDVASNRLEYHLRIKPTNVAMTEDDKISINEMSLEFRSFPTPSTLYSVGQDEGTKNSSQYRASVFFRAKKDNSDVLVKAFDLYRKCKEDGGDFKLVKHVTYKTPRVSAENRKQHIAADTDSGLEDGKTYEYKVIVYTNDNKKSVLTSSNMISVKVPKSTSLLLDYPLRQNITSTEAENLGYVFKFSNPEILKEATEMKLGLFISDRTGTTLHISKFRYVFADTDGKPEVYFATKGDAWPPTIPGKPETKYEYTKYSMKRSDITGIKLEDLINVDREKGIVKIQKDFFTISKINHTTICPINYKKGEAYYWDMVDYGKLDQSDHDDEPCQIIQRPSDSVTIISIVNDSRNGSNAWNGRGEFTIKFD